MTNDRGAAAHDPAEAARLRTALRATELFREVSDDLLDDLIPRIQAIEAPAGAELIKQGDTGREMYLVDQGLLEVRVSGAGVARRLGTLGPGDVFGEMALLRAEPRMASISASEPSRVWVLPAEAVAAVIRNAPALAASLQGMMRRRQRANAMRALQ